MEATFTVRHMEHDERRCAEVRLDDENDVPLFCEDADEVQGKRAKFLRPWPRKDKFCDVEKAVLRKPLPK